DAGSGGAVPRSGAALNRLIAHSGFHSRVRVLNCSTRVLPVSPNSRTTYCAVRPRKYTLPDDEVPIAVNDAESPVPSRIGSAPGGVPPGSTGGRPGITPNSTPGNASAIDSGAEMR